MDLNQPILTSLLLVVGMCESPTSAFNESPAKRCRFCPACATIPSLPPKQSTIDKYTPFLGKRRRGKRAGKNRLCRRTAAKVCARPNTYADGQVVGRQTG